MANRNLSLSSHIEGVINGQSFVAEGTGDWDATAGTSQTEVSFDVEIPGFVGPLCGTWSCKHHPKLAAGDNPLDRILEAGSPIGSVLHIYYPFGEDFIVANGIQQRSGGEQTSRQLRIGRYSGPTDFARQLPFSELFSPAGPGRATGHSARSVEFTSGFRATMMYRWQLTFSSEFELDRPFQIDYEPTISWDAQSLTTGISMSLTGGYAEW